MRSVLLIGNKGFIGQSLYRNLIQNYIHVDVVNPTFLSSNNSPFNFLLSSETLEFASQKYYDYIVDCVGLKPFFYSKTILATPDLATLTSNYTSFLKFLVKCDQGKFVFLSSGGSVYGTSPRNLPASENDICNPITPYGMANYAIENLLSNYESLILRGSNVYGRASIGRISQGFIEHAINSLVSRTKFVIKGSGTTVRDYIYIKDFISIITKLFQIDVENKVLNIGSGIGYSQTQIIELINSNLDSTTISSEYDLDFNEPIKFNVLNTDLLRKVIEFPPVSNLDMIIPVLLKERKLL